MSLLQAKSVGKKASYGNINNFITGVENGDYPGWGIFSFNKYQAGFASSVDIIRATDFGNGIKDYENNSDAFLVVSSQSGLIRVEDSTDVTSVRFTSGGSVFPTGIELTFPTPGALFTYQPVDVPAMSGIIELSDARVYDVVLNTHQEWRTQGYLIYKKI